ncbi:MAG: hypothetical protein WDZ35_07135 [Crocinitomicaceae bacterium]
MRYFLAGGILIVGLIAGFFLGRMSVVLNEKTDEVTGGFITETVYDTIIKTETLQIQKEPKQSDTLENIANTVIEEPDTLIAEVVEDTTEMENDLSIKREKLIDSRWMKVIVLEEKEEKDSLIKDMLGIHDKMPDQLLVEFWESPLSFSGYKLSKSKLILYDMPAALEYKLYRTEKTYYLSTESMYYLLKETEEFLPYKEVKKEVVFND